MTWRRPQHLTAALVALAAGAAVLLAGWGDFRRPSRFEHPNQLDRPDCRLGVFVGTGSEELARRLFPHARILVFDDPADVGAAMLGGRLEGFISDEHVLNVVSRAYPLRFRVMDESLERQPCRVLLAARNERLREQVNAFIADYKRCGTYDDMFARWCLAETYVPIPKLSEPAGSNGTLRVGTSGLVEPSSFLDDNGELTGYDVEFALRLGRALDRKVSFLLKPDGDFDRELVGGKVDVVIDNCVDPVCPKGIVASDGYLDSDKKVLLVEEQPGLDERLDEQMLGGTRFGMKRSLIKDPRGRLFVIGFVNTFSITLLSALLGFAFAKLLRRVERSLGRPGVYGIDALLAGVRWTPPLVLLLLFHGALLPWAWPWFTAVVAFGFWFASYLEPVADSDAQAWLPVFRLRLPVLLQWTSVVGYISVFDLTLAADLVCGRSAAALLPLLAIVLAYGLIAWLIDRALALLERKCAR